MKNFYQNNKMKRKADIFCGGKYSEWYTGNFFKTISKVMMSSKNEKLEKKHKKVVFEG